MEFPLPGLLKFNEGQGAVYNGMYLSTAAAYVALQRN